MNADNTFYSVKRLIGQDYESVEDEAQRLAYTVTADEDGFAVVACSNSEAGGRFEGNYSQGAPRLQTRQLCAPPQPHPYWICPSRTAQVLKR